MAALLLSTRLLSLSFADHTSISQWAVHTPAEECNLGGFMRDGRCECYPTFSGRHCAQLALRPAETSLAIYRANASSWGGSPVRDEGDGSYHLYFADMQGGCGLQSWECNSAVAHAMAPAGRPEGPYSVSETIVPPFGHNPTLLSHNGTWYVYHIGAGTTYKPKIMNCSGGVTAGAVCGAMVPGGRDASAESPIIPNVAYSRNGPRGPWQQQQGDSNWALNNPTMFAYPNGTTLSVYKVSCNATISPDPKKFCRQFALAIAPHPLGPFEPRGTIELFGEDAHVWRCPFSGTFRLLFQGGAYTAALPQWQGHFHMAFSRDGISDWTIAGHASPGFNDTIAFSNVVELVNGSAVIYQRRERHQLLIHQGTGEPTHLFQGGMSSQFQPYHGADKTQTIVQPLRTARAAYYGY